MKSRTDPVAELIRSEKENSWPKVKAHTYTHTEREREREREVRPVNSLFSLSFKSHRHFLLSILYYFAFRSTVKVKYRANEKKKE